MSKTRSSAASLDAVWIGVPCGAPPTARLRGLAWLFCVEMGGVVEMDWEDGIENIQDIV